MKMRCERCVYLNWDFLTGTIEKTDHDFCGLHGRAQVDINGKQQNLDSRGGCGFSEKARYVQLELEFT